MPFARNHIRAKMRIPYKTCQVGFDRWLSRQPSAPAAEEWDEIRGYDKAAGTRETAEMWNVSWIFAPVTVQKHDVVAALQLGKDVLSSPTEDSESPNEISLLEGLFCKRRMLCVIFNRVLMSVRYSCGRHNG